jgi:hypothetical protein
MNDRSTSIDDSSPSTPPGNLAALFHEDVRFDVTPAAESRSDQAVVIERVELPDADPTGLDKDTLPFLAIPEAESLRTRSSEPAAVLMCAEGRDTGIARSIIALLRPDRCAVNLVHVTWLPGVVPSPIDANGLDNPHPTSLLAFRDARTALIDRADELRAAGFTVTTHLRMARDPADAIVPLAVDLRPGLVILGLGRHGAGIGETVMRDTQLPVLFVASRDRE